MKKLTSLLALVTLFATSAFAQLARRPASLSISEPNEIPSLELSISYDNTTHIVFPSEVVYVDLGSPDLIASTADQVTNIVRVKANLREFLPTNMTVVTKGGQFYTFECKYVEKPEVLAFDLNKLNYVPTKLTALYTQGNEANMSSINRLAEYVLMQPRALSHLGERRGKIVYSLTNVYTDSEVMYLQMEVANNSSVDYATESLRFYVRDKKRVKRSARQEIEIVPLITVGDTTVIANHSVRQLVVAVPRFTLQDNKVFQGELREANGGRHMRFAAEPSDLFNARKL